MDYLQCGTNFGLQLLQQQQNLTGSLAFSPIYLLYGMYIVTLNSRYEAGNEIRKTFFNESTEKQLNNIIDSPFNEWQAPHNIFANFQSLFGDSKMAARQANEFMFGSPEGNTTQFFRPIDFEGENFVLANKVFFKSAWQDKFNPNLTFRRDFFSSSDSRRSVEFLGAYKVYRKYAENDQFQVLSLPYENKNLSMNIFLPKNRFGLNEAIKNLNSETIQHLLSNVSDTYMKVIIPKWKIETVLRMDKYLPNVGVKKMFTTSAEHSVYFTNIFHRAAIEIDENGSNSIVTDTVPNPNMSFLKAKQTKYFIADHPFFFILTNNNHPVFMGTHY